MPANIHLRALKAAAVSLHETLRDGGDVLLARARLRIAADAFGAEEVARRGPATKVPPVTRLRMQGVANDTRSTNRE